MKFKIRALKGTKYSSEPLNYSYWFDITQSEELSIEKCELCRKFKTFFMMDNFNEDWKDLQSYEFRCKEIQNLVLDGSLTKYKDHHYFGQNRVTKNYWIFRGFTGDESIEKISKLQRERSQILKIKYSKEERRNFQATCIEYWLIKGYSIEEAKEIISKNQSKFSLKILLEKYDTETAKAIMDERNLRWQKSLNENNDMEEVNSRKDSGSLNYYISKYGDSEEAIKRYKENCYNLGTASRGLKRTEENCKNISIGIGKKFRNRRNQEGTDYSGIVYVLHFPQHKAIKIGLSGIIGKRSLELERTFGSFNIIKLFETDSCFKLEGELHDKYSNYRTPLTDFRHCGGWTEFFSDDILELINS